MNYKIRVKTGKGPARDFYRAGIRFTPEWREYPLTEAQAQAVKAEPMLEVLPAESDSGKAESLNVEKNASRGKK